MRLLTSALRPGCMCTRAHTHTHTHTGEEQAKVELLSGRLAQLGEDVDGLLAGLSLADDGDEGASGGDGGELL